MNEDVEDVLADPPAKDHDGVPYCRTHHCRMTQASGGRGKTSYYRCKVPKCDATAQKIRTNNERIVPQQPLQCPRCKAYCERDLRYSTAASVVLRCPACQWRSTAMAVPQFAAAHLCRRPMPVEEIGGR